MGPLQNPVGAKIEPKINHVASKNVFVHLRAVAVSSPDVFLHFGNPLAQYCYRCESNRLPFASLLLSCSMIFMFFAAIFEPNIAKHAPRPPIKLCQDRHTSAKIANNLAYHLFSLKKDSLDYVDDDGKTIYIIIYICIYVIIYIYIFIYFCITYIYMCI